MNDKASTKHQDNTTLWGSVTIDFIKSTSIYEMYENRIKDGTLYEKNVIEAVLYYLGMDINHYIKYTAVENFMIRDASDKTMGIYTTLYTFPVRKNYRYKDIYNNNGEYLTASTCDKDKIDLSSYGTQHYTEEVKNEELTKEQMPRYKLYDLQLDNRKSTKGE